MAIVVSSLKIMMQVEHVKITLQILLFPHASPVHGKTPINNTIMAALLLNAMNNVHTAFNFASVFILYDL